MWQKRWGGEYIQIPNLSIVMYVPGDIPALWWWPVWCPAWQSPNSATSFGVIFGEVSHLGWELPIGHWATWTLLENHLSLPSPLVGNMTEDFKQWKKSEVLTLKGCRAMTESQKLRTRLSLKHKLNNIVSSISSVEIFSMIQCIVEMKKKYWWNISQSHLRQGSNKKSAFYDRKFYRY